MDTIIEMKNVSKCFWPRTESSDKGLKKTLFSGFKLLRNRDERQLWALKDINLTVERGSSLGLIGSNGCGKSTLLRLVAGITEPTSGTLRVGGKVAGLIELTAGFHDDLSGLENVYLNGAALGLKREEVTALLPKIEGFAEIGRFIYEPVRIYSSGMLLRLGFALAIHTKPDILVVDEALAVGDARFQKKCLDRIRKMQAEGVTLLFVSHAAELVESVCENAAWINDGRVREYGAATAVLDSYNNYVFKRLCSVEQQEYDDLVTGLIRGGRFGARQSAVKIQNVVMTGADRGVTHVFRRGDRVHLTVTVGNSSAESVPCSPAWSLNLVGEGPVSKAFGEETGRCYSVPPGTTELECSFATDILQPNTYLLSIGLMRPGDPTASENLLDSYLNLVRLQIVDDGPLPDMGFITLQSEEKFS